MSYLVLARKWRPGTFEAIIGQEHVTRALKNAIRLDRVAHAFLFTGARGVGKTTAARVLAKALQCEAGPTPEPCTTCRACTEIATGNAVDVLEIDGASNRGINEIRELRDGVAYAPARDRFKIYIIDEVHMLTQEAFNALLKTLEEPPRHVKFIFATTEPQKIPVTILSRCQRYDFKRVPLTVVKAHLNELLEKEGVHVNDEGLRVIARESEGSVRDALSLLDRVISFAGENADARAVTDCLGVADRAWIGALLERLLAGDAAGALDVIADVFQYGYDLRAFAADALESLRDLVVVRVAGKDSRAVELSDGEAEALRALGERHSVVALERLFQIMLKAADEAASSRHPKLVLEMAIVRAVAALDTVGLPEVLQRLEALEASLGGAPQSARPIAPRAAPQAPSIAPPRPMAAPRSPAPAPAPAPAPSPAVATPRAAPVAAPAAATLPLDRTSWRPFVQAVKAADPILASMLENADLLGIDGQTLRIGVASAFFLSSLQRPASQERLRGLVAREFGPGCQPMLELTTTTQGTLAAEIADKRRTDTDAKRERVLSHPATAAVVQALDGRVIDVRVEEESYD